MSGDAMVPIAHILGRGGALTVAAMLDAAGIIVHVGGEYYTSVLPHIVAMGGFRLTVPAWQHADASQIIGEMLAQPEPVPSRWMPRAIFRLALAGIGSAGAVCLPYALVFGAKAMAPALLSWLFLVGGPVNPQGRADYYLVATPA